MNLRNKDKLVAKGTLESKEKTYVVGGNMLGVQYVAVRVRGCTYLGDEKLVRPYEKFQTVRDAMGSVIAWPRSHVSMFPFKQCVCSNLHMCDMLFIRNLPFFR